MPIEITPSSSDPALAAYDSPIGCLTLAARGGALVGLWVTGQRFFGSPYGIDEAELPPVSWTTKLKSKKQEAFHVYKSGSKT